MADRSKQQTSTRWRLVPDGNSVCLDFHVTAAELCYSLKHINPEWKGKHTQPDLQQRLNLHRDTAALWPRGPDSYLTVCSELLFFKCLRCELLLSTQTLDQLQRAGGTSPEEERDTSVFTQELCLEALVLHLIFFFYFMPLYLSSLLDITFKINTRVVCCFID